jgi:uncharacterized protein
VHEFLAYARRGNNSWWRYLATPVLAFVLLTLVQLIADTWTARAGLLPPNFTVLTRDASNPVWFYGYGSLLSAGLLLSLLVAALVIQNKNFADLVGHWRWAHAAAGAAAGLALVIVATGVDYAVHPAGFQLIVGPQTVVLALVAIPYCLLLVLFDEVFYRGFAAQGLLLATKRPLVVAVGSGALSMLGVNSWPHAADAFVWGFAAGLIAIRTGGIAFTWGMAAVTSLFNAVVSVESDDVLRGSPGIFAQTTPDLAWLDVVVSCVLMALLWVWVSRRYPASKDPTLEAFT